MIKPAQIPPEVVEELHSLDAWRGSASEARAAVAAALAAWPGAYAAFDPHNDRCMHLPLPQQDARDE